MKLPIIPEKQVFFSSRGDNGLNLKAICIFAATGFFLEKDTYFNNLEVLQPATEYEFDENRFVKSSNQYWQWHYSPRDISFKQTVEEFAHLIERISNEKLKNKDIILPLSGGLDSRTQAAAIQNKSNVKSYSYKFEDSFDETKYGNEISKVKLFPFTEYIIPRGYLWKVIDKLADINNCYADFTNPRQMAVIDEISKLGNVFYLGHWGDVLFDDMRVKDDLSEEETAETVKKKVLKKGGFELGASLWKSWGIAGDFNEYFKERISGLLGEIKIENANSRIRAFKSMYWAPRWTSANMNVFSDSLPLVLPYYDDEMCKFICSVPEKYLAGRQIQIEYIKMKSPALASIPWQNYDPFNLYNYKDYKATLSSRIIKKGNRMFREKILNRKVNLRNWEIQFIGKENDQNLREHLFGNKAFSELVNKEVTEEYYRKFVNTDEVYYSHPVTMLLTLSVFSRKFMSNKN